MTASVAAKAVAALDDRLVQLLGYADLLAAHGHEVASGEMRRSLMQAIRALRALRHQLRCIEFIEGVVRPRPLAS